MLKNIILLIVIVAIGWYVYNNYIKSDFEQAIDATEEVVKDVEDSVDNM